MRTPLFPRFGVSYWLAGNLLAVLQAAGPREAAAAIAKRVRRALELLLILFVTQVGHPALAQFSGDNTWYVGAVSGAWRSVTNWGNGVSNSIVPGSTTGTTNTNTATFDNASSTTTILPDVNRNLGSITFSGSAAAYVIGLTSGNALLMTNGGEIQIANTFTLSSITETIDAPLVLEGSYTFANNSTNAGVLLDFGGAIMTAANPLTLSGAGNISISGSISGVGSINKTGSGTVYFTGANSYSGGTTVTAGILITNTLGDPTSPIVVSAAAGVNSALVLGGSQQGQTIGSLSGTVSPQGSALVSISANDALTVNQATNTTFGGTIWNSGTLIKSGAGTLEVEGAPTWGDLSNIQVTGGGLRLNAASGSPSIGVGVTAVVSSGATLELAGSVSALANGVNRVNITNNSNAPGILVSGTNQEVGDIDGSGTTQVNAGSDLTANHIIQGALVIGGAAKNPGLVTIDASGASGNPLAGVVLLAAPSTEPSFDAAAKLGTSLNGDPVAGSPAPLVSSTAAVPEPSSLFMLLLGGTTVGLVAYRRRSRVLNVFDPWPFICLPLRRPAVYYSCRNGKLSRLGVGAVPA